MGAITAARGDRFLAGFASGVIGKVAGFASQSLFGKAGSGNGLFFARTAIAAAGGCAGAVIAKGSCTNGAVTAAFAHMYNYESQRPARICADKCVDPNRPRTNPYNYGSRDAAISKTVLEYQLTAITAPFGGIASLKVGSFAWSGATTIFRFAKYGKEIAGKSGTWRIAPFGNRTGHRFGRFPHYHRKSFKPNGKVRDGQGISRHRPWEKRPDWDKSFWDRF